MPEDGLERELIRGELRERPKVFHVRAHAVAMTRAARHLENWLDTQPEPRGEILAGAGFILGHDPETGVGIDITYVDAATPESATFVEGAPILAVEILSPTDTVEEIDEKVALYLECGVPMVWVLNPRFRTVTVYRPGVEPILFNAAQELADFPELPGFRVPVASLFSR